MNDQQFDRVTLSLRKSWSRQGTRELREYVLGLQAQRDLLVQAVDLLTTLTEHAYYEEPFLDADVKAKDFLASIDAKVAAHQAQGTGAMPAQDAQLDKDTRIALLERELDRTRERADMAEVELQHARAALYATQPAAAHGNEPEPKYRERSNHVVLRQDDWQPCYCWADNDHRVGQEVEQPVVTAKFDTNSQAHVYKFGTCWNVACKDGNHSSNWATKEAAEAWARENGYGIVSK